MSLRRVLVQLFCLLELFVTQEYSRLGAHRGLQKPSKFQRCEMGMVLHIQSQLSEGNKKSPLTLSMLSNIHKITASQQSVLTPHRNQKSILSCISSSPSLQYLNGYVANPLRKKKKIYQKFILCPLFYFLLQEEDERIPTHPFTQRTK